MSGPDADNYDGENFASEGSAVHAPEQSSPARVAIASLIGTTIEWYDFYIYGTAAALVFNVLFFPEFDPIVGTLLAFATFGVGAFFRPLGGFVFGHFGDRVGRKSMLVITLMMMGVATLLIGLLPTYGTIGVWAPILLVGLRIVQGFALGGEWSGAALMSAEYAPRGKLAFYTSGVQLGSPVGLLLGTSVFGLFTLLPDDALMSWGWRMPFLLSFVLVFVGMFIRLRLMESPEFLEVKEHRAVAQRPLVDLVRSSPKQIIAGIAAILVTVSTFYIVVLFGVSYGMQEVGLSRGTMLTATIIGACAVTVAVVPSAILSDRLYNRGFNRGFVGLIGAAFIGLMAFPYFIGLNTGVPWIVWVATAIIMVPVAIVYSIVPAYIYELFPVRIRYSGSAASYAVAAGVFGGFSPTIVTGIFIGAGNEYWGVALFMIAIALISFIAFYSRAERQSRTAAGDKA